MYKRQARNLPIEGRRLLVLTAVGNRSDEFIMGAAKAFAGKFDRYICSNFTDLRGRAADDVPALLRRGCLLYTSASSLIGPSQRSMNSAEDSRQRS